MPPSAPSRTLLLLLAVGGLLPSQNHAQQAPARPAAAAPSLSPADASTLQQALADYDAGKRQEATPILLRLAARYPSSAEAQAGAGIALAEAGDLVRALPFLLRAHQLAPADTQASANLAAAYLGLGQPAEALPLLQAACRQSPADPALWLSLAQAQMAVHDAHAATTSFQTAATLFAQSSQTPPPGFAHDRAVALLADHRPAEAAALLSADTAADTEPANLLLRAEAEEQAGSFEAALHDLQRAATLDPSEPNLYLYADELLRHLTFPSAIRILQYATGRYPGSARLHMALGIAFFGNGSFADAAQVFLQQLRLSPEDTRAAALLGRSCAAELDKADPACAALLPFAEAHPRNAPAALYAAIVLAHQPGDHQDPATTTRLLQSALHADPALPEAWYELGSLQQAAGAWSQSVSSLERATALRPDYPEAHYRLSRAYAHLARRDEAQQQIALQQKYAHQADEAQKRRMQEVMTFLTTSN